MSMIADRTPRPSELAVSGVRVAAGFIRGHAKLLGLLAAAVCFALAVGLGVRWWTHPDLLNVEDGAWTSGVRVRPVERAQQTYGVVLPPGPGTPTMVTFRSIPVATFAANSAHATVTFAICHRPPGARGYFIEGMPGSGDAYCTRVEPIVAGTTFRFPTTAQYIIATSTPTQAGKVVITGANLDYSLDRSHWYRRGVEHVDFHIVQRVS